MIGYIWFPNPMLQTTMIVGVICLYSATYVFLTYRKMIEKDKRAYVTGYRCHPYRGETLIIVNKGFGQARNIEIKLDDVLLEDVVILAKEEKERIKRRKRKILGPQGEHHYGLSAGIGKTPKENYPHVIMITWQDDMSKRWWSRSPRIHDYEGHL